LTIKGTAKDLTLVLLLEVFVGELFPVDGLTTSSVTAREVATLQTTSILNVKNKSCQPTWSMN
jgi:hypothetical protein